MSQKSLILALLVLGACKKHVDDPVAGYVEPPPPAPAPPAPAPTPAETVARNFERVQFVFDSAELTAAGKAALQENAALLTTYTDLSVEVQGHCDERGTTEYNLALGQARAQAVRKVLLASGASGSRVTAISYGEERPLEAGDGEVVWAENRRAEFRVTTGTAPVRGTVN
jgi:peptidoglycan-associated lipoprotein